MKNKKPWAFCETPEEKCTMNYCDENGCQNRKRNPVYEKLKESVKIESIQIDLGLTPDRFDGPPTTVKK